MQIIFKIKDILLAIQNLKKKFAKRSRLKQDKKIGMVSTALTNIQFSSIQSWLDDHNNTKMLRKSAFLRIYGKPVLYFSSLINAKGLKKTFFYITHDKTKILRITEIKRIEGDTFRKMKHLISTLNTNLFMINKETSCG